MFNKSRDTNYNPNDNTQNLRTAIRFIFWTLLIYPAAFAASCIVFYITVKLGMRARWIVCLPVATHICIVVLFLAQIGPYRLVMWSNAMRFRRGWFDIWTDTVKAKDDHSSRFLGLAPLLGIIPRFDGSMISWKLLPPKGETMEFYTQHTDVMTVHSYAVEDVNILFEKATSKHGRLQAVFTESLLPGIVTNVKEQINELV